VGNPANTNALVAAASADGVPAERFTALTRLDENRARAQFAQTLGVPVSTVRRLPIWGNHSATQFPDVSHTTVGGKPAAEALAAIVGDVPTWLDQTFIPRVACGERHDRPRARLGAGHR
jgi:malate dehydrogenase